MNNNQKDQLRREVGVPTETSGLKKVIDIVCGMELDPANIKHAVEYKEETYYFCSDSCRKHFVDDPKRYLG